MKYLTISIVIILGFSSTVSAFDHINPSENDKKLMTLASLALIDYQQTVQMLYKEDGYYEMNPILGTNPDREDLMMFGLTGMTIAYGINELMPEGKFKDFMFDSMLATEKYNIEENKRVMTTDKRNFDCIMMVITLRF